MANADCAVPSLLVRLQDETQRKAFVGYREQKVNARAEEVERLRAYVTGDDCVRDLAALAAGDFNIPIPRQLMLRKAHSQRRRTIYAFPEPFNDLLKYLVWGMHEYDGIFSPSLYSFRQKRGTSTLFSKVTQRGCGVRFWVTKADVHDYGHSIVPAHLMPMLHAHVYPRDPMLFALLERLLTLETYTRDGRVGHGPMGGLPGAAICAFFNNVYLMGLDACMDDFSTLYARYADDICVFTNTEDQAREALCTIREKTGELGLSLNESKSQVIAPGGDIELLGVCIRGPELDVSDHTLAKAQGKLHHYANRLMRYERRRNLACADAACMMVNKINRYFYGKDGGHELSWSDFFFRVITRPDSLHAIDLYCQDLIRIVGTGKRGGARYRLSYDDLRDLGYRPLVASYWRQRKGM